MVEYKEAGVRDLYGRGVRRLVRQFWNGNIDRIEFAVALTVLINQAYSKAFALGLRDVGIYTKEMTPAEAALLARLEQEEFNRVQDLASLVYDNRRAVKGKYSDLLRKARLNQWPLRLDFLRDQAKRTARRNPKLKWVMSPEKEHCPDCLRLHNRVYRRSTWDKWDIYPKHTNLACGGFNCGCSWEETDEPVTPGRPPKLTGPP